MLPGAGAWGVPAGAPSCPVHAPSNGCTFVLSSAPGAEPQRDLHLGLPAERRPEGSQRSECPESDFHCNLEGLGFFFSFKIKGVLVFERHQNIFIIKIGGWKRITEECATSHDVSDRGTRPDTWRKSEGPGGWGGAWAPWLLDPAGPLDSTSPMRDQDARPADLRPLLCRWLLYKVSSVP